MSLVTRSSFHVPDDLALNIFSFCNDEDLMVRIPFVCKEWRNLSSDNSLWHDVYSNFFKMKPADDKASKESYLLKKFAPIDSESKLLKIVINFMCNLKWDTKRKLKVIFPNEPTYSLDIERFCSPHRRNEAGILVQVTNNGAFPTGTEAKFGVDVAEVECYRYTHPIAIKYDSVRIMRFFESYGGGSNQLATYTKSKSSYKSDDFNPIFNIIPKVPLMGFFRGQIEIDVGFGNRLAYFSDINDWRAPFNLFCVPADNGASLWIGCMPFSEIKFVKIDAEGQITWEEREGNRSFDPIGPFGFSLNLFLLLDPIIFAH